MVVVVGLGGVSKILLHFSFIFGFLKRHMKTHVDISCSFIYHEKFNIRGKVLSLKSHLQLKFGCQHLKILTTTPHVLLFENRSFPVIVFTAFSENLRLTLRLRFKLIQDLFIL